MIALTPTSGPGAAVCVEARFCDRIAAAYLTIPQVDRLRDDLAEAIRSRRRRRVDDLYVPFAPLKDPTGAHVSITVLAGLILVRVEQAGVIVQVFADEPESLRLGLLAAACQAMRADVEAGR